MTLSAFGAAVGVPGISASDAIEATQYAIWRYTELTYDAAWSWTDSDSENAYWYLVNGANASGGMTAADLQATAGITEPAHAQAADSLIGPFTVSTNQPTASVTVNSAYTLTDASGAPIDTSAVTDGQEIYLDLRGATSAGSATVTVSTAGSNLTGKIVSVPNTAGGTPTVADHAQTLIITAPSTATVTDSATVSWAATAVAPAPAPAELRHPTITTRASASRVVVGHPLRDEVTIAGFAAGGDATGTAELYGPYSSRTAATCANPKLVEAVSFAPRNGTVITPAVTVTKPGYYVWVASTSADAYNTAASHGCGLATETTLVHKRSYGAPVVDTGFSGIEPGPASARLGVLRKAKVRYVAVGVSARAKAVGLSRGAVQVPGNTSRLGLLAPSAGLGDAIGTTVVVGHVSDKHDSPGAFYRLTKAKKGQIIKVTQAGHTYRFRVTHIRTYSRANGGHPPASVFRTTGAHHLVLISCAGKVVHPDGHFHYTRNVVVTATAIR
jgi:hypothetical protein